MEVMKSAGMRDEMLLMTSMVTEQSRLRTGSCSHHASLSWEDTGIRGDCNVLFMQHKIAGPCHDTGDGSYRKEL